LPAIRFRQVVRPVDVCMDSLDFSLTALASPNQVVQRDVEVGPTVGEVACAEVEGRGYIEAMDDRVQDLVSRKPPPSNVSTAGVRRAEPTAGRRHPSARQRKPLSISHLKRAEIRSAEQQRIKGAVSNVATVVPGCARATGEKRHSEQPHRATATERRLAVLRKSPQIGT
jgi:hypothetical protein